MSESKIFVGDSICYKTREAQDMEMYYLGLSKQPIQKQVDTQSGNVMIYKTDQDRIRNLESIVLFQKEQIESLENRIKQLEK